MIVTRRRKKRFPWKRLAVPGILLAAVAAALWWAPSRSAIARATQPAWKPIAAPFDALARQHELSSQQSEIRDLRSRLTQTQTALAARDKQIAALQSQLNARQSAPHASAKTIAAKASPAPSSSAPPNGDLAAQATPDMRRTAAVWTAMDSEAAAKLVQKLPPAYVVRVFSVMQPDATGAIMENLPAAYAAKLTQEEPG